MSMEYAEMVTVRTVVLCTRLALALALTLASTLYGGYMRYAVCGVRVFYKADAINTCLASFPAITVIATIVRHGSEIESYALNAMQLVVSTAGATASHMQRGYRVDGERRGRLSADLWRIHY